MIKLCNKNIDEKHIIETIDFVRACDDLHTADLEIEDEKARRFAKELGYKPDVDGNCDNITPTPDLLKTIFDKAKRENSKVAVGYKLRLSNDYDTEWYEVLGEPQGGYLACSEWGEERIGELKAYAMPSNIRFTTISCTKFVMFREDVANAIKNGGFKGIDFVWVKDVGRYKAPQYFSAYPTKMLPYFYCYTDGNISKSDISNLSESIKIIYENTKNFGREFPLAIDKDTLPESDCDFVGISSRTCYRRLLIRKKCRDFLIEKGLAKVTDFEPVLVVEKCNFLKARPLRLHKLGKDCVFITEEQKKRRNDEYLKHLKKEKPIRVATENIALKELRLAKREAPEYFSKRATEKVLQSVLDERLIPYYKVANGGAISDEYNLLSIDESIEETTEFHHLQTEYNNLICSEAVVFAKAADGEYILLLPGGEVVRYQLHELQLTCTWPSLASFFLEEIET